MSHDHAATKALPDDLLAYMRSHIKAQRDDLDGFLAIGNEVNRAATYDRWLAALAAPAAPVAQEATKKLAGLASFLAGWKLSPGCKNNGMEGQVEQWISGIHELFAAPAAPVAQGEPVRSAPYNPTPAMIDAARRIDPALRIEDIRALWAVMWSAAPAAPVAQPVGRMSRATMVLGSGAGYKEVAFRFADLEDAEQVRLWAETCGAKLDVSVAPRKLIGWRTSDYLMETADPDMAKNWQIHHDMLPIFEGDPITKLAAPSTAPAPQPVSKPAAPLTDEQANAIAAYYDVSADAVVDIYKRAHGIGQEGGAA